MIRQTCLSAFYLLSQILNLLPHFSQKWDYTNKNDAKVGI